jgi:hypothetical protein
MGERPFENESLFSLLLSLYPLPPNSVFFGIWGKVGKGVGQFQPGSPSSFARILSVSSREKTHSSTAMSSGIWYLICSSSPSFQTSRGTSLAQYRWLIRSRNKSLCTLDQLCSTWTRSPGPPVGWWKTNNTPCSTIFRFSFIFCCGKKSFMSYSICHCEERSSLAPPARAGVRRSNLQFSVQFTYFTVPLLSCPLQGTNNFPVHRPDGAPMTFEEQAYFEDQISVRHQHTLTPLAPYATPERRVCAQCRCEGEVKRSGRAGVNCVRYNSQPCSSKHPCESWYALCCFRRAAQHQPKP